MNPLQQPHPTPQEFSSFGLVELEDEASAVIEDLITNCTPGRTVLEQLPGDTFLARLKESARPDRSAASAPTLTRPAANVSPTEVPAELAQHPRYRVKQVLGAGGMGTVYLAEHLLMERPVALKVLSRNM